MADCQIVGELNNIGVAFLDSGDLSMAFDLFRDTLKYTMGELDIVEAARIYSAARSHGIPSFSVSSYSRDEERTAQAEVTTRSASEFRSTPIKARITKKTVTSTSAPFVHSKGINIIPSPTAYSPDVLVNTTIFSGIIIFNLAVVYHLRAIEEKCMCAERLNKARSLYQKCRLLLTDAGVPSVSSGNPVIDMLAMALFNNLAQSSYELTLYEDSKTCFDCLVQFALTVVPGRYGDPYVGTILDQLRSNFLLNAIILHAPKFAAAA